MYMNKECIIKYVKKYYCDHVYILIFSCIIKLDEIKDILDSTAVVNSILHFFSNRPTYMQINAANSVIKQSTMITDILHLRFSST